MSTLLSENPHARLSKDFVNMLNGKYTDVEFVINDQKINAHKCVLAARSSVFDAMFQHNFEEKKSNSVVITDISHETFFNMINYIYTENTPKLPYEAELELLVAADKVMILFIFLLFYVYCIVTQFSFNNINLILNST